MKRLFPLLFALCLILSASSLENATALFEHGNYDEALPMFEANSDNPEAQYYLGKAYLYGLGVEKVPAKALEYAQKSAAGKSPLGINLLGVLYLEGVAVEKDETTALLYFTEAAELGNAKAMINIAQIYINKGTDKRNIDRSILWLKKAVEHGSNRANQILGNIYASNQVNDHTQALSHYKAYLKKEEQDITGIAYVYLRMARIYQESANFQEAYRHFKMSAEQNNAEAMYDLYTMLKTYPHLATETNASIHWLEKAAYSNDSLISGIAAFDLYLHYRDSNDMQKAMQLAAKFYADGNVNLGCYLAQDYFNETNYQKAYETSSEIIETSSSDDIAACYFVFADLSKKGVWATKDLNKSISLLEKGYHTQKIGKNIYAESIAESYLNNFNDPENTKLWCERAYSAAQEYDQKFGTSDAQETCSGIKKKLEASEKTPCDVTTPGKPQIVFPLVGDLDPVKKAITAIESEKYYFVAAPDKGVYVYEKPGKKFLRALRGEIGSGVEGGVYLMAFDETNELLYCATMNNPTDWKKNDIIKVFNVTNGNLVKILENKNSFFPNFITLSDDGRYLAAVNNSSLLNIIDTKSNEIQHYNFYPDTVQQVNIRKSDDDYLVYVLDSSQQLHVISVLLRRHKSKEQYSGQITFQYPNINPKDKSKNVSASHDISGLDFIDSKLFIQKENNTSYAFDFNNVKVSKAGPVFASGTRTDSHFYIKSLHDGAILEIYNKGSDKPVSTIPLLTYQAKAYQIIENKFIVVTTNDVTQMLVFTLDGKPIARLQGYTTLQPNMLYRDGYLFTYGKDNVVHFWDTGKFSEYKTECFDKKLAQSWKNVFGHSPLELLNVLQEDPAAYDYMISDFIKNNKLSFKPSRIQLTQYFKIYSLAKEVIPPQASIYIHENDWIVYDQQGFFASSPEGKNLLRYHVNQGLDKAAKIVENDRLYEKLYRPDLIRKKLLKEEVKTNIDVYAMLLETEAPSIEILSSAVKNEKDAEITYQVCDQGSGFADTSLILNGSTIALNSTRGFTIESVKTKNDRCTVFKDVITLPPGKSQIAIKSFDKERKISTTSPAITLEADYKAPEKPDLHFLSIAVADYRDQALKLTYPVSDVESVREKLQLHAEGLFSNIYTYALHDKDVSLEKLETIFDVISAKANVNDVFVMYIAGHGLTGVQDGLYYFLPYDITDTTSQGLKRTAISVNQLRRHINKIKANKSLIMIDTCNSGSFVENVASRGLEQRMAAERLANATGRNYIVASSNNQAALEGYKNHGIFTYAVINAFDRAYIGDSKELSVSALSSYVENIVPKITKEKFNYEQFPQKYLNGHDFPIGLKIAN